jgi:hypothetical protein
MGYNDYQKNKAGLDALCLFIQEHSTRKVSPFVPMPNGDSILDSDDDLRTYTARTYLEKISGDFELQEFDKALSSYHEMIRHYRRRSRVDTTINQTRRGVHLEPVFRTFLGRWEKRMRMIRSDALNGWRDRVKFNSFTMASLGKDLENPPDDRREGLQLGDRPAFVFSHQKYGSKSNVQVEVTSNFFTHVMPLFGNRLMDWKDSTAQTGTASRQVSPPFLEKISEKSDGTSTFQYLVLAAEDVMTEIDGQPTDHGIKIVCFHALETFGRDGSYSYDNRSFEPVKRYLAFTGDYVNPNKAHGTGTSAKRAYSLLRNRIARNMMKQL